MKCRQCNQEINGYDFRGLCSKCNQDTVKVVRVGLLDKWAKLLQMEGINSKHKVLMDILEEIRKEDKEVNNE